MKINSPNTIKFFINLKNEKNFKDIPAGAEIRAKIIERTGSNSAIMEIQGRRVKAEFTGGLPEKNSLVLKLEGSAGNGYTFRLIREPDGKFFDALLDYTIFSRPFLMKRGLETWRQFGSDFTGIFELNRRLAGSDGKNSGKGDSTLNLLNSLLKMGLNRDSIINLSLLLQETELSPAVLSFLYALTGAGQLSGRKKDVLKNLEIEAVISDIINQLDTIEESSLKDKVIDDIIELLLSIQMGKDECTDGEMYIFEEPEFRSIRYLFSKDSLIFALNFSNLGNIEIIGKKSSGAIYLSLFSENENVISILKDSVGKIYDEFSDLNLNVTINFFNTKILLDKIKEISSSFMINSTIDFRA